MNHRTLDYHWVPFPFSVWAALTPSVPEARIAEEKALPIVLGRTCLQMAMEGGQAEGVSRQFM